MAEKATPTKEIPAWQQEADQRTKELTEKLENGIKELFDSDKYKDYLKAMSHFHNYSSRNIMLIHAQMPGATKVASFKLWKEQFNRSPKRGETSLRIWAPIGKKEPETKLFEKLDPTTNKPMLDKEGNVIMEEMTALSSLNMRFKLVPVFDVSQTVGDPLPQLAEDLTGNVEHYEAFLDTLKDISPLPIVFEPLNENQDGYCRFGEKISIREGMSEIQTVSAIIHEITHARLHDKNIKVENTQPAAETADGNGQAKPVKKSNEVSEIEAESVSYVVCQKYGIETGDNSFGYLASWSNHDMAEFKASLDTIRKEANNLINAIDDRFNIICKERGIDITAVEQNAETLPTTKTAEVPAEPQFTTESTTENIAGVDFTVSEVVPKADNSLQAAAEQDPIHAFITDYYQYILDVYRNGVPRDTPAQVEKDMAGLAEILRNGKTDSFREAIERAGNNSDTQERAAALLQRLDEMFPHTAQLTEPTEVEHPTLHQAAEPTSQALYDPMPDPTISIADMENYGYTYENMLPLNQDRAIDLFNNQDCAVFLLYNDGTEAMVFDSSEITAHDGIFGVEREDWQRTEEYHVMVDTAEREAGQSVEAKLEADFVNAKEDTFAIYQIMDGMEFTRDYRFEGMDYLEQRGLEVNRNHYVLVHTEPLAQDMTLDDIYHKYNDPPKDFSGHSLSVSDIIVLNKGGEITNHFIDRAGFEELLFFIDVEKLKEQSVKQTASAVEQTDSEIAEEIEPYDASDEMAEYARWQREQDLLGADPPGINIYEPDNDLPNPITFDLTSIPVYKGSYETARTNDEQEDYDNSDTLNFECSQDIDKAITDNSKPGPMAGTQYVDTEKAARSVIEQYGAERVAWVLAGSVQAGELDGRFSDNTKEWAKGFDVPKEQTYHLKTHRSVLDGFIEKFRKVEKEKPSLMAALDKGEKRSRAEHGGNAPDKSERKNNEER